MTGVEPHLFVIFGATGDLARRKVLASVYSLSRRGGLGQSYRILGVTTDTDFSPEKFRALAAAALEEAGIARKDAEGWAADRLDYQPIGAGKPEDFERLRQKVAEIEEAHATGGNRVFYLAIPPQAFEPTIRHLGGAHLNRSEGWTRLVIEKPFGTDLESAKSLNRTAHRVFAENEIYRIDHYLGKELVQNLLVLRFSNVILESLWHRERVDNVQITVAESLGVESRGRYYDNAGALRDMVQNHMTQLVTLIAMEPPVTFDADAIRTEKLKVLHALRPIPVDDVVLGQYAAGTIGGTEVRAYREEPDVPPDSRTETYVALKLMIDTWRWQGVPFYLRTGKRLPKRTTQIVVTFREPPVSVFGAGAAHDRHANALVLTLQPDEGFELNIDVKAPTEPLAVRTIPLHFRYSEMFPAFPDAYETLIEDVLRGDQTLFVRADEAEASWTLYEPVIAMPKAPHPYAAGSWGPPDAARMLARGRHLWRNP